MMSLWEPVNKTRFYYLQFILELFHKYHKHFKRLTFYILDKETHVNVRITG